jgi:hypothetical protein
MRLEYLDWSRPSSEKPAAQGTVATPAHDHQSAVGRDLGKRPHTAAVRFAHINWTGSTIRLPTANRPVAPAADYKRHGGQIKRQEGPHRTKVGSRMSRASLPVRTPSHDRRVSSSADDQGDALKLNDANEQIGPE